MDAKEFVRQRLREAYEAKEDYTEKGEVNVGGYTATATVSFQSSPHRLRIGGTYEVRLRWEGKTTDEMVEVAECMNDISESLFGGVIEQRSTVSEGWGEVNKPTILKQRLEEETVQEFVD